MPALRSLPGVSTSGSAGRVVFGGGSGGLGRRVVVVLSRCYCWVTLVPGWDHGSFAGAGYECPALPRFQYMMMCTKPIQGVEGRFVTEMPVVAVIDLSERVRATLY